MPDVAAKRAGEAVNAKAERGYQYVSGKTKEAAVTISLEINKGYAEVIKKKDQVFDAARLRVEAVHTKFDTVRESLIQKINNEVYKRSVEAFLKQKNNERSQTSANRKAAMAELRVNLDTALEAAEDIVDKAEKQNAILKAQEDYNREVSKFDSDFTDHVQEIDAQLAFAKQIKQELIESKQGKKKEAAEETAA